jgi:multimeric flavodoxin WrbA
MKVLGILGSPRKYGNTEILLDVTLSAAQQAGADTELIRLSDKNIQCCDGCNACRKTGECRIKDDMQELYGKLLEADGIIFATPVYTWTMSGQMKVFLDRTYALSFPVGRLAGKIGGSIVVGARQGHQLTQSIFYLYYSSSHMFAADWVNGFAWEKGGIKKDKHAMHAAVELGNQIILLIKQGYKYPGEYDQAIYRYVPAKYKVPMTPGPEG